jgi:hypothetical protein
MRGIVLDRMAIVHHHILAIIVILLTLDIFVFKVVLIALRFSFEVLRTGIRVLCLILVLVLANRLLHTLHIMVFAFGRILLTLNYLFFTLFFFLLSTVSGPVILLCVDIWLLGWKLGGRALFAIPLDREPGHSRLLSKNASPHLLHDRLRRRFVNESLVCVFVVDIVAHTDELTTVVGAGKEDDCDAEDLGTGDTVGVWWIGFEDELVDAYGDRPNKE